MFDQTVLVVLILAAALCCTDSPALAQPPAGKVRIALAGDSTVTDDAGWGAGFARALHVERAECVNFARTGRSSASFRSEGRWDELLASKPQYVLIQFGHNEEHGHGADRESDPATTYRANIARYVDEARAAGVKPVLLTPLARRQWDEHGRTRSSLAAYADAVRAVASEKEVPLIDLHFRSIEVYESYGRDDIALIRPSRDDGQLDSLHLNEHGGKLFGALIASELRTTVLDLQHVIPGYRGTDVPHRPHPPRDMTDLLRRPTDPPTAQGARTLRVAGDGSADFRTVQAAVDAAPESNLDRTTIQIAPGTYVGLVVIPRSKINLSFVGAGTDKTILSYALAVNDPVPANAPDKMFGTGVIVLGDGFEARDLTFRNSSGDHGQAMALRVQADRVSITNCRLLGWQDTLLAHSGRQYYRDCYIEGRVDFIYGRATAVFDRCEIHSKNGGYITASSAEQDQPFGFVFLDCRITGWGAPAYLGRPWRDYAAVAFIRCEIGAHIRPEGWHNWSKPEREQTARYAEFGNTGPGAERAGRVSWSKQLTPEQAAEYTIENILAGDDGWNPSRR